MTKDGDSGHTIFVQEGPDRKVVQCGALWFHVMSKSKDFRVLYVGGLIRRAGV